MSPHRCLSGLFVSSLALTLGSISFAGTAEEAPEPRYTQVGRIESEAESDRKIRTFKMTPGGELVVALAPVHEGQFLDTHAQREILATRPKNPKPSSGEIRIYDGQGKVLQHWATPFAPQAVGLYPDGDILVAGQGRLARYSRTGELKKEAESPSVSAAKKDLAERTARNLEALRKSVPEVEKEQKRLEEELEVALKKGDPNGERETILRLKADYCAFRIYRIGARTVEDESYVLLAAAGRVDGMAIGERDLYFVDGNSVLWRTSHDFAEPRQVLANIHAIDGPRGDERRDVGQYADLQIHEGKLWAGDSFRRRICPLDAEGKSQGVIAIPAVKAAGPQSRFREPLNFCFTRAGDVVVAHHDGQVERFTREGKSVEVLARIKTQPEWASSPVALSADEKRLYCYDRGRRTILAFERNR
jgi:hypothetical protein